MRNRNHQQHRELQHHQQHQLLIHILYKPLTYNPILLMILPDPYQLSPQYLYLIYLMSPQIKQVLNLLVLFFLIYKHLMQPPLSFSIKVSYPTIFQLGLLPYYRHTFQHYYMRYQCLLKQSCNHVQHHPTSPTQTNVFLIFLNFFLQFQLVHILN